MNTDMTKNQTTPVVEYICKQSVTGTVFKVICVNGRIDEIRVPKNENGEYARIYYDELMKAILDIEYRLKNTKFEQSR